MGAVPGMMAPWHHEHRGTFAASGLREISTSVDLSVPDGNFKCCKSCKDAKLSMGSNARRC